jgi:hypothetical protein
MAGPWWVLLLTGIAWLIISVIVLRFTTISAATIGVLLGVVFLAAMAEEFFIAYVRLRWRWRWRRTRPCGCKRRAGQVGLVLER